MDFCAGIGGGRLGLTNNNMTCVGYSEIENNAIKTYNLFYGQGEKNYGDLMKINSNDLPEFDMLIGGFPCQTFSVIGNRKGFEDERGQIIYGILKILKEKNISYFILENVKGLVNHNKGETLKQILNELSKDYFVDYKVLNSIDFGVPQMRERIYFVGIRKDKFKSFFLWPNIQNECDIKDFLSDDSNDILEINDITFQKYLNNKYNKNHFNIDKILEEDYLVIDTRQSDMRLYKNKIPTLRTGRHGILYVKDKQLKKLSGYESLLCQGFSKELAQKAKDNKIANNILLSLSGNAMTVNVIESIGKSFLEYVNG